MLRVWRLKELKRKKKEAIQDKTDEARKKGRGMAEKEVAEDGEESEAEEKGEDDQSDASSSASTDSDDNYQKLLHDVEENFEEKKLDMFHYYDAKKSEFQTFDPISPTKFFVDITDLDTHKLYNRDKSAKYRVANQSGAIHERSNVFFPIESYPESIRCLIEQLMEGPNQAMEKFLTGTKKCYR